MVQGLEAIPYATRHPRLPSRRETTQIVWSALQDDLARIAPRLRGVEPDWEPLHDDRLKGRGADNATVVRSTGGTKGIRGKGPAHRSNSVAKRLMVAGFGIQMGGLL